MAVLGLFCMWNTQKISYNNCLVSERAPKWKNIRWHFGIWLKARGNLRNEANHRHGSHRLFRAAGLDKKHMGFFLFGALADWIRRRWGAFGWKFSERINTEWADLFWRGNQEPPSKLRLTVIQDKQSKFGHRWWSVTRQIRWRHSRARWYPIGRGSFKRRRLLAVTCVNDPSVRKIMDLAALVNFPSAGRVYGLVSTKCKSDWIKSDQWS